MDTRIENQFLAVESKTAGAELTSIRLKADGTEYLWQADPKYWNRRAPLLFPIVGSVANNQYAYGGKQYPMKNHGFARDSEFTLASQTKDSVTYALAASDATLAVYPFRFRLEIGYSLKGSAVAVGYTVANEGDGEMPFSIGAHPAFNCPLSSGDAFTDYYLEFERDEWLDRGYVNAANLLIAGRNEPFLREGRVKPMTEGMFDDGAYILEGVKSTAVSLKGRNTNKSVTVRFPGFPYLGIWAPPGAPFVCIEPWYGIAESTDFIGDLTRKRGILKLQPGGVFKSEYLIEIR